MLATSPASGRRAPSERVAEPRALARRESAARGTNSACTTASRDRRRARVRSRARRRRRPAGAAREPPPKKVATDVSKPSTGPASTREWSSGAVSAALPPDCAAVSVIVVGSHAGVPTPRATPVVWSNELASQYSNHDTVLGASVRS
jgi:hypothetical protein